MVLNIKSGLSIRKIENEIFIYDRNKALIHTFNETGTFFWEAIECHLPIDEIIEEMIKTFEVSPEEAFRDTEEFIQKLRTIGIVE